jgi:hypothetical protein
MARYQRLETDKVPIYFIARLLQNNLNKTYEFIYYYLIAMYFISAFLAIKLSLDFIRSLLYMLIIFFSEICSLLRLKFFCTKSLILLTSTTIRSALSNFYYELYKSLNTPKTGYHDSLRLT